MRQNIHNNIINPRFSFSSYCGNPNRRFPLLIILGIVVCCLIFIIATGGINQINLQRSYMMMSYLTNTNNNIEDDELFLDRRLVRDAKRWNFTLDDNFKPFGKSFFQEMMTPTTIRNKTSFSVADELEQRNFKKSPTFSSKEQHYDLKQELAAKLNIVRKRASDLCTSIVYPDDNDYNANPSRRCKKPCTRFVSKPNVWFRKNQQQNHQDHQNQRSQSIGQKNNDDDDDDPSSNRQKNSNAYYNSRHHVFSPFVEVLPDFPCFPSSGCRCPSPTCMLERRTDSFAENFRSNRNLLTQKRNEFRMNFNFNISKNASPDGANPNTFFVSSSSSSFSSSELMMIEYYYPFASQEEKQLLQDYSAHLEAVHDEFLCVKNPFYIQHDPHSEFGTNTKDFEELQCENPNRPKITKENRNGDDIPSFLAFDDDDDDEKRGRKTTAIIEQAERTLQNFKRASSWAFSRWYDWRIDGKRFRFVIPNPTLPKPLLSTTKKTSNTRDGVSAPEADDQDEENDDDDDEDENRGSKQTKPQHDKKGVVDDDFDDEIDVKVSGRADPKDGIYRLRNVCIKPDGSPYGYFGRDSLKQMSNAEPRTTEVPSRSSSSPNEKNDNDNEEEEEEEEEEEKDDDHRSEEKGKHRDEKQNRNTDDEEENSDENQQHIHGNKKLKISRVAPFKGASESAFYVPKITSAAGDWISRMKRLRQPPKIFIEGNFLLMSLDWKSDHPAHTLYRFFAGRNIAKKIFGIDKRKKNNQQKSGKQFVRGYDIEAELGAVLKKELEILVSSPSSLDLSAKKKSAEKRILKKLKQEVLDRHKQEEDFHVFYLANPVTDTGKRTFSGYKYYVDLLGSSWSSILSSRPQSSHHRAMFYSPAFLKKLKKKSSPSSSSSSSFDFQKLSEKYHNEIASWAGDRDHFSSEQIKPPRMVCFREIAISQTCASPECWGQKLIYPGNGYQVPYLRPMSVHQKIFVQHFRKIFIDRCFGRDMYQEKRLIRKQIQDEDEEEKRRNGGNDSNRRRKTRVTLLVRTRSRTDMGLATAIPMMARKLNLLPFVTQSNNDDKNKNKQSSWQNQYELRVIAQDALSAEQFLSTIHFDTDILIGSMGGSLIFLMLMETEEFLSLLNHRDDKNNNAPVLESSTLKRFLSSSSSSFFSSSSLFESFVNFVPRDFTATRQNSPFLPLSSSVVIEMPGIKCCTYVHYLQGISEHYQRIQSIPNFTPRLFFEWKRQQQQNDHHQKAIIIPFDSKSYYMDSKRTQGWNLRPNCDFGGLAMATGINHLVVTLPIFSTRGLWKSKKNFAPNHVEELMIFRLEPSPADEEKIKNIFDADRAFLSAIYRTYEKVNNKEEKEFEEVEDEEDYGNEEIQYLANHIVASPKKYPLVPLLVNMNQLLRRQKIMNNRTSSSDHQQQWKQTKLALPQEIDPMFVNPDKGKSGIYVGRHMYLHVLDSALCRHFAQKKLIDDIWRTKNKNKNHDKGDEDENTKSSSTSSLNEKCPWDTSQVRYTRLEWGVDS